MKTLITLVALGLSLTSFAGTFLKEDSGRAEWIIKIDKEQKGTVSVGRSSQSIKAVDLSPEEQIKLLPLVGLSGLGTIIQEELTFETTDARSIEAVTALIKKKMTAELGSFPGEVIDAIVTYEYLNCQETGFFKKQLVCSARYKSSLTVEMK